MSDIPADIQELSFEAAMAALEKIVSQLESGQAPLEDSIDLYTRGTLLKKHCEAKLTSAQARIEKLTLKDGQPTGVEPLSADGA